MYYGLVADFDCGFRVCSECGQVMFKGYMEEDGDFYCCEGCMETLIASGELRHSEGDDVDEHGMNCEGGFYDRFHNGHWTPTSVFYTEWLDCLDDFGCLEGWYAYPDEHSVEGCLDLNTEETGVDLVECEKVELLPDDSYRYAMWFEDRFDSAEERAKERNHPTFEFVGTLGQCLDAVKCGR